MKFTYTFELSREQIDCNHGWKTEDMSKCHKCKAPLWDSILQMRLEEKEKNLYEKTT